MGGSPLASFRLVEAMAMVKGPAPAWVRTRADRPSSEGGRVRRRGAGGVLPWRVPKGPGRGLHGGKGDSEEYGQGRAGLPGKHRGAGWPRRHRGCSSVRIGSDRLGSGRGSTDRPQSAEATAERRGSTCRRIHCRSRCSYSRSTSSCFAPEIGGLGSITMSRPGDDALLFLRKASRRSLFTRLRVTAPPIRRLTARPSRSVPRRVSMATRVKSRPSCRAPFLNTRR